jgi:beta-glucosidase
VLLKNEGYTLPIPSSTKRIAVIGSEAVEARLGGYSGPGNATKSILDGLRDRLQGRTEVVYAPGPGRTFDSFQASTR